MGENILKVADPVLKPHAEETVAKFTRVLNLFSKCHHGYNSSIYMNAEKIEQLGMNIPLHSIIVEFIGVHVQKLTLSTSWQTIGPHFPK